MAIKEPFRPLSAVLLHISLRCISAFHTVCLLCHSLFNGDPLLPAIQSFTFLGLKVITTLICCPLLCMPECIRSWLKCPPAAPRARARARAYTRWWSGGQWGACAFGQMRVESITRARSWCSILNTTAGSSLFFSPAPILSCLFLFQQKWKVFGFWIFTLESQEVQLQNQSFAFGPANVVMGWGGGEKYFNFQMGGVCGYAINLLQVCICSCCLSVLTGPLRNTVTTLSCLHLKDKQ